MSGRELRQLRESLGITQVQLAARLGYTQPNVSAFEARARVGELLRRRVEAALYEMNAERTAA